jgi:hypothetical protein
MITDSNSPAKGSGIPNHYAGELLHTMAISGLSRVRTELSELTVVPALTPHPLQEVLIMAVMNLLTGAETACQTRKSAVAEIKRRPSVQLKYSIKRAAMVVGILALVSIAAVAQENRSEISIQGTGFFEGHGGQRCIRTCERDGRISSWLSLPSRALQNGRPVLPKVVRESRSEK